MYFVSMFFNIYLFNGNIMVFKNNFILKMGNIRSILLVNDFVLFSKLLVIYCIKIHK